MDQNANELQQAMDWVQKTKAYIELKRRIEDDTNSANKQSYLKSIDAAAVHLHKELEKIVNHFSTFTYHNLQHCNKVIDYMFALIPDVDKISDEELVLIIYSGLFHDVGMAYDDEDVKDGDIGIINSETYKVFLDRYNQDEKAARRETIRTLHGELAELKIEKYLSCPDKRKWFILTSEDGVINGYDISNFVKRICRSHQEEVAWIQTPNSKIPFSTKIPGKRVMSPQYVAYLLRIADLLDIDCKRAPKYYEWVYKLNETSKEHFLTNQVVSTAEKLLYCGEAPCSQCVIAESGADCPKKLPSVCFEGSYPQNIEDGDLLRCKVHEYIAYLENEIVKVNRASKIYKNYSNFEHYVIKICEEVINRIETLDGHPEVSPQPLSVDYNIIRELFLGNQLYQEHTAGLRELIQNAYDACKAKRGLPNLLETWEPKITIAWNETDDLLKISDNGIGMNYLDITEYFLSVGKSKFNYDKQYLYSDYHSDHIGHFGIGFFATFMLSESVSVFTSYFYGNDKHSIRLNKKNSFASIKSEPAVSFEGTTIELTLSDVKKHFETPNKLKLYIEKFFLEDGIEVSLKENSNSASKITLKALTSRYSATHDLCLDLSDVLNGVQGFAYLRKRKNSLYTNKNIVFDGNDFYEKELKEVLSIFSKSSERISYLNFPENDGLFNVFINVPGKPQDISQLMGNKDSRVRYSYGSLSVIPMISTTSIEQLCEMMSIAGKPKYADIIDLNVHAEGDNFAIVKASVNVSDIAELQKANDSCGLHTFTGNIYIRDVLIPKFECCIPFLDEEYEPIALFANIKTKDIFPDLNRQSVSNKIISDFQYAVGKAITQKLKVEVPDISHRQDIILKNHYSKDNAFIKKMR